MTTDRIPVAHSVVYVVRGVPEVADEYNAERTIAPHEITLTYRAAEDSQLGRVHAYVKGWWMQDGARVPMDKPVGRHFWGRDFTDWPEWLVEEARLHDPEPAAVPPVDRAALRDRIAAAIWERQNPGRRWADCEHPWGADAEEDADAVMAVLPEPADRAAVLREAIRRVEDPEERAKTTTGLGLGWEAARDVLRRMADEAKPAAGAASAPAVKPCPPGCIACATDESHDPAEARQDGARS